MAKNRPIDKCKLCEEVALLCDSHYLPKRLYKIVNAPELKNPNPVVSVNGVLKQVSAQYRGFVFCESCEDLLNKKGEKWILENLPKQYGGQFPLQDALASLTPMSGGARWERYNVSGVKTFDVSKLVHFGSSVFWRGAVHDWKTNAGMEAPPVDLGVYREPLRKFVFGTAPFPDEVVLTVDIWPYKFVSPVLQPVVTEQLPQDVRRYWFCVPGLYFFLFVGANIPKDARESRATDGIITLDLNAADSMLQFFRDGIKSQHVGAQMDAMFKEIAALRASKK